MCVMRDLFVAMIFVKEMKYVTVTIWEEKPATARVTLQGAGWRACLIAAVLMPSVALQMMLMGMALAI